MSIGPTFLVILILVSYPLIIHSWGFGKCIYINMIESHYASEKLLSLSQIIIFLCNLRRYTDGNLEINSTISLHKKYKPLYIPYTVGSNVSYFSHQGSTLSRFTMATVTWRVVPSGHVFMIWLKYRLSVTSQRWESTWTGYRGMTLSSMVRCSLPKKWLIWLEPLYQRNDHAWTIAVYSCEH